MLNTTTKAAQTTHSHGQVPAQAPLTTEPTPVEPPPILPPRRDPFIIPPPISVPTEPQHLPALPPFRPECT
jgi:hypothetical protein